MEQIGKPLMPVPKHAWRKALIKLMVNAKPITAPESSKISVLKFCLSILIKLQVEIKKIF